jgi:predicted NBD/HSP70 family sugar kinase
MRLIEVFDELDLRQSGSTAIDVDRLLSAAIGPQPTATALRAALGQAISGVLAALVALADPETIIIGGPWSCHRCTT